MFRVRVFLLMSLALATVALSGCCVYGYALRGSGRLVTKDLDITGFDAIEAQSTFQVEVTQGETYSVSVTADDNVWERLEVGKRGDTLRLGLQQPRMINRVTLRAKITMPALEAVEVSGASRVTARGFGEKEAESFRLRVSGASRFSGDIQAGDADLEISGASRYEGEVRAHSVDLALSGASRADVSGSVARLHLDVSGASTADMPDLTADGAEVRLSGASRAELNVTSDLDYELSGASTLTYAGRPRVGHSEVSGGSSVHQR